MEKLPQRNLLLPNAPITPFSTSKKSKHTFKQMLSTSGSDFIFFCFIFNVFFMFLMTEFVNFFNYFLMALFCDKWIVHEVKYFSRNYYKS